jgi:hypothetical protein
MKSSSSLKESTIDDVRATPVYRLATRLDRIHPARSGVHINLAH